MDRRRLFAPPASRRPVPVPNTIEDVMAGLTFPPNNGILIRGAETTKFQITPVCNQLRHPRSLRGSLNNKITILLLVEAPLHQLLLVKPSNYLCLQFNGTAVVNMTTDILDFSHLLPPPIEGVKDQVEIFQVGFVRGSLGEGPEQARIIHPDFLPLVGF